MKEAPRQLVNDGTVAELLYLLNLLLLPGVTLLLMGWWRGRLDRPRSDCDRIHIEQSWSAAIKGLLLLLCCLLPLLFSGIDSGYGWMVVLMLLITLHTTLVMTGIIALAFAMSDRPFHYPLIGGRREG